MALSIPRAQGISREGKSTTLAPFSSKTLKYCQIVPSETFFKSTKLPPIECLFYYIFTNAGYSQSSTFLEVEL